MFRCACVFCVVCLSAALPGCCGVETGSIHQVPTFTHQQLLAMGHSVGGGGGGGGGSGLCIGKLYRTKLFEGVEGDGSVEGWILPSWCSDVVGTGESAGVILQSLHL